MDSYEWALKALDEHVDKPMNGLDYYWYRPYGELRYSEENTHPDDWEEAYHSDRVRQCEEVGGFTIMRVDDCSGGEYQIIFLTNREVSDE